MVAMALPRPTWPHLQWVYVSVVPTPPLAHLLTESVWLKWGRPGGERS